MAARAEALDQIHAAAQSEMAQVLADQGIRVEAPEQLAPALHAAFDETGRPSIIDVMATRDPARMLPAVDNRAVQVTKGDPIAGRTSDQLP